MQVQRLVSGGLTNLCVSAEPEEIGRSDSCPDGDAARKGPIGDSNFLNSRNDAEIQHCYQDVFMREVRAQ